MARLKPLWLALPALARRIRESARLRVACDYDGTLTPIVSHPREARLGPRMRAALAALVRLPGVEVAILSGRRLTDLGRQVGVRGVWLSGVVGLETRAPGGPLVSHVPPGHELPAALAPELRALASRVPGAWIEDKRWTLAVHYRHVAPGARRAFRAAVVRRLRPHRGRHELVLGKMAVEVVPALGWNKGKALARMWPGGGLFVSIGDDENDEPVHEHVRARRGISVAVGRARSRAEYALGSPEEVAWWLEWLAREREAARP